MAAYDGYRSQPDPHHQPYPSKSNYDYDYSYDAPPRQSSHHQDIPSQYQPQQSRPRSRSSSNTRSEGIPHSSTTQQPLNNAIGNAFDKSDTARAVDPDLIAQITAEVKKSVLDEIKMSGVAGAGIGAPQAQPATTAAPPPQHYVPQSPASTTSASIPSRNVYTPPSPKHQDFSSHGSVSPDSMARDSMFDANDDTPTPRYERTKPVDIPSDNTPKARPAPTSRMSHEDYTPIEKMWQRLFDHQNQPTIRLGQFLRGLAMHLIDDYEPKKSLVVTPSKMLKFYEDVKLHDEIYPWQVIFGQLPYSTLSKIYREMRCEHHLVQEHPADQPHIPALTPEGFQEWMTTMILAYPDTEYQRLSKAVLDMPISNADNCKERFPKELPRRLFPHEDHLQAQQRCAAVMSVGGIGPLRRAPTFPPPPPPPMGQSNTSTATLERERSPYATSHNDSKVFESEDEHEGPPISMPLERERKPYSAAPGKGKVYTDDTARNMHSDASTSDKRRTQSATAQSQWVPPPNSTATHQYTQHRSSIATDRRPRSPSFSNYGTRSDPSVRDVPGSFYASNIYDSEEESRRLSKDGDVKRTTEHHRRSTAGTDSSYESQPRSIYDDDYYRGRGGTNGYDNRGYESRRY